MKKIGVDLIIGIITAVVVIYVLGTIYFRSQRLEGNHRYTVATVKGFEWPAEGGRDAAISYQVNGSYFKGSVSENQGNKQFKIGDRLFIEFYPPDPDLSQMVYNKDVPDTLINIPVNGWDSIPCFIPY